MVIILRSEKIGDLIYFLKNEFILLEFLRVCLHSEIRKLYIYYFLKTEVVKCSRRMKTGDSG